MRHRHSLPAAIGMLALAMAGCGAQSTNDSAPAGEEAAATATEKPAVAADPCSYISKEEVTAVIGETIVDTKADGFACRYDTDDAMAAFVQVDIKPSGGADEMAIARSAAGALGAIGDEMQGSGGAAGDAGAILSDSASAPKIGDHAFFGANQQLSVLKGDVYFAVSPPQMRSRMSGGNPLLPAEKKREMAAAIAQKIAAKL